MFGIEEEGFDVGFSVRCIPPKSTKQTTLRFSKGRVYHTKEANIAAETLFSLVYPYRPTKPLDGALAITIEWVYPWRKSEPKKNRVEGRLPCSTRPDVDNLLKGFCDVLQAAGFFLDDAQLAEVAFGKYWGELPQIAVGLRNI